MKITFCGHAQINADTTQIENQISKILTSLKCDNLEFYLGDYGHFDKLARKCCSNLKKYKTNIKLIFVTPYINDKYLKKREYLSTDYDLIIYPPLETTPKKLAIIKRNQWMVDNSDLLICYVNYPSGGSSKTLEYAIKRHKHYINLGSYNIE